MTQQLPIGFHAHTPTLRCAWQNCRYPASPSYPINVCVDHFAALKMLVQATEDGEFAKQDGRYEPLPAPPPLPEDVIGHVYYLRIGDRIKVGYASNLQRRMRQYPPGSELLAVHPGTMKDEREAHSLLAIHRLDGREWFADVAEVREHIQRVIDRHGQPPPMVQRRKSAPRSPLEPTGRPGLAWKVG